MKKIFLKLTMCVAIITLVNSCNHNDSKTFEAIQGKWYNIDGTTKTIEVRGDKWIEDAPEFGKTTYSISFKNDSVFDLKVLENKNTITFYKEGMVRKLKLKSFKQNVMSLVEIGTDGINEFNLGSYKKD